jgi:hypothetical protein
VSVVAVGKVSAGKDPQARAALSPVAILAGAGLIAIGFIMLFIENQQTFYFHVGAVLLTVAGGALCGAVWAFGTGRLRILSGSVFLLWGISLLFLLSAANRAFLEEAHRTTMPSHQAKLAEYQRITAFVDEVSLNEGRRLTLAYDPELYQLDGSSRFRIIRFWGEQVPWGQPFDAIIVYKRNTFRAKDSTDGSYGAYNENVCGSPRQLSKRGQCLFVPVDIKDENVAVFLRADVYTRLVRALQH